MAVETAITVFSRRYGGDGRVFRAPGRVNLIGEHTDYNDGLVLPFAIDRDAVTVGRQRADAIVNISAIDVDGDASFDLGGTPPGRSGTWQDHAAGVIFTLRDRFGIRSGADIVFTSAVPVGAGLSSSAAMTVSLAFALTSMAETDIRREDVAFAAQQAEHDYVGIRSGIMDQFTAVFGREGHAMLLDCRSLERRYVALPREEAAIVVCDSGVKHTLASSEYNLRREQCEEGVALIQKRLPAVNSLRDVSPQQVEETARSMPEVIYRRCRHVVTEIERTARAAKAFERNDLTEAGRHMAASHRSLRDDYEVSCAELDTLVDAAMTVSGTYGARMTGGGFGGCTVNLIRSEMLDTFKEEVCRAFADMHGRVPRVDVFHAADGASEVSV
jgi:galactokinase